MQVRRRFGQHFLEPVWVPKILRAIDPKPGDLVIEIGPGRGALTLPLAACVRRVVAVEIDRDLACELAARVPPTVKVVTADVLEVALEDLPGLTPGERPLRVVGNLPYNISSPILTRLTEWHRRRPIDDATILLQREFADRLVAQPGSRHYGPLGILVGVQADVRRLLTLPPGAFRPRPRVVSTLVRLAFRPPRITIRNAEVFERLVRALFSHRRKTLVNALAPLAAAEGRSAVALLTACGLEGRRRPETLTLEELGSLAEVLGAPFS